jgi:hypothetical protein
MTLFFAVLLWIIWGTGLAALFAGLIAVVFAVLDGPEWWTWRRALPAASAILIAGAAWITLGVSHMATDNARHCAPGTHYVESYDPTTKTSDWACHPGGPS